LEKKIKIIVEKKEKQYQIRVIDNGIGISEEDQQKIFNPFNKIQKAKDQGWEGIGLGMYHTKILIEQNNGSISLKSKLGVGTTFNLSFPVI
jgi:signal transduction histidine kinase